MAVTRAENVIKMTATADAVTDNLIITKVRWVGDAIADGNSLVLTNTATGVIFEHVATADDTGCDIDFCGLYATGVIATFTSSNGTVYIYHK